MRTLLLSVITMMFISGISIAAPKQGKVNTSKIEEQIVQLINEYRQKKGLPKLKPVDYISKEALKHSKRMAKKSVPFGHAGFDDRMNRIQKHDDKSIAFAENVAYGNMNAQTAVDMWLNSAGHKKNITGKYSHTGVGVYRGKGNTLYFTQIFVLER